MQKLLFLVFIFLCGIAHSQDTICVYYASGEFRLAPNFQEKINEFVFSHDLKKIDSISVLGYTDSTGQKRKNLKLSDRRALYVKKHLNTILSTDRFLIHAVAKGEEGESNPYAINHRRVELILYCPPTPAVEIDNSDAGNSTLPTRCFKAADSLQALCNVTYFKRGNTKLVKLQLESFQYNGKQKIYTLSAKNNAPKLVKWETRTSGDFWWKRPRYVAIVKEADYEKYGLLIPVAAKSKDDGVCIVCDSDRETDWQIGYELLTDAFVMQNMQLRKKWIFNEYELIIPKEFLSIERTYYLDSTTSNMINWEVRPGKQNAPFYFAYIPAQLVNPKDFRIYSYQKHCSAGIPVEKSYAIDTLKSHYCSPSTEYQVKQSVGLELDFWHTANSEIAIGAYYLVNYYNWEFSGTFSYSNRNLPMLALQGDYHFFGFSVGDQYMISGSNQIAFDARHKRISTYAGSTVVSEFGKSSSPFVQDLHLGIEFWNNCYGFGFDKFFLQAGYGYNYSAASNASLFTVRFGIRYLL